MKKFWNLHKWRAGTQLGKKKFKFCIECKKGYNDQTIYSLLDYNSKIWQFIEQSEKDAKKLKKGDRVSTRLEKDTFTSEVKEKKIPSPHRGEG